MGINITGMYPNRPDVYLDEPCLCAQNAPSGCDLHAPMTRERRAELAEHAWADCSTCHGSGVEKQLDVGPFISWSEDTGRRMFDLMLLPGSVHGGGVSLDIARAGVQRGRGMLRVGVGFALSRPGGVFKNPNLGAKVICSPLDPEGMLRRLDQFEAFLTKIELQGAAGILWG